jgi:hypothetical protein
MILVFFAAQHYFHESKFRYELGNIQVPLPLEEKPQKLLLLL